MDPLVFATLVSLLVDFRGQRADAASKDVDAFTAWLAENRHEELVALIRQNVATSTSVKALLHVDHKVLMARLERLDNLIASLASAVDGFGELATSLRPNAALSEQAKDILRQYKVAGASRLLEGFLLSTGTYYSFMDGTGLDLKVEDPQFIADDFATLVDIGLLRLDHNSSGKPVYIFTRPASLLVDSMKLASSA